MDNRIESFSNEVLLALRTYWERFLFNLPKIVLAILIFVVITFIAVRISRFLNYQLSRKAHDQLFSAFIAQLSKYALILCGVMLTLQIVGLSGVAGGLLAGAGVSALIFGFAFKDIGENFLSGIILAFNRPFNLHDTIKINEYMGRVESLSFRNTHIKTFDEKDVYIPNSIMVKETLTNLTRDGRLRLEFLIGIAYEDDIKQALELIVRTVNKCNDILREPHPFAVVEEFVASTVNIKVFFWTATDDYRRGVLITKSEIMTSVKNELISNGFTLPADIQELKVYDKRDALPVKVINNHNVE